MSQKMLMRVGGDARRARPDGVDGGHDTDLLRQGAPARRRGSIQAADEDRHGPRQDTIFACEPGMSEHDARHGGDFAECLRGGWDVQIRRSARHRDIKDADVDGRQLERRKTHQTTCAPRPMGAVIGAAGRRSTPNGRLLCCSLFFILGLQLAAPVSHNTTCVLPRFVSSIGSPWPDLRTNVSCVSGAACEFPVFARHEGSVAQPSSSAREIAIVAAPNDTRQRSEERRVSLDL